MTRSSRYIATVRTGGDGSYTLSTLNDNYTIVVVTDDSTVDTSSGSVFSGVTMKAASGGTVVSTATTMMVEGNLTVAQLNTVLGLAADIDHLTFNPFAAGVDAGKALAVEKASKQIFAVVNAFAGAIEGSGASQLDAFKTALNAVVDVITTKAGASGQIDLTDNGVGGDLTTIKGNVTTALTTGVANADLTSFTAMANDTATGIKNVNAKIATVTDLTSDATKNIFSITKVLEDQIKKAVSDEKTTAGTGDITFTDTDVVDTSATNNAPTDITLTSASISELANSLVVGILGTTDTDQGAGVAFTYAIGEVSGTDYASFSINQATGALSFTSQPDYETKSSYSVTILSTDDAGKTFSKTFTITVTDADEGANNAPLITVSNLTAIAENDSQAVVATVGGTDAEDGSRTVSISGGGSDDAKFEIVNNQLRIKTSADFEAQDTYQVQLSVTDSTGNVTLRTVEFKVTDVAEAVSGSIVDGYVAGATIFQDLNNNNILDSGEPFTVTSATGSFVLSGVVSSATAPLKMISGFDIGTNQAIVTTLGVPSVLSGNAVASPIATITSINQAKDADTNIATVVDRVATYFNVSQTSQTNFNILTADPITNLASGDTNTVSAAKDVFEANQFIMGLTHISEQIGSYLVAQIDAAIQGAGENGYGTYAGSTLATYEKLGADAFLNTSAEHITSSATPTSANAFQIKSAQIEWQDYDATLGLDVTNRVMSTTSGSTVSLGSDPVKLNVQNLINAANSSGTYKSPTLSFELLKIPTGSGSGTINFTLIDGSDGTRSGTERQISLDVTVNWTGDGTTATITLPAQTLSGSYITNGLTVDFTVSNLSSDAISITQGHSYGGTDYPTTLDVRLASVIDTLEGVGSISLLQEGTFNLSVTTNLPLKDVNDVTVTKLQTNLQLVNTTPLEVFVEDVTYFEDDPTPTVTVYLNRSHTEDVTITYNVLASGSDSATAGSDFTGQSSQTVTILAGLTSVSIALPILADSSVESAETFSVTVTSTSVGSLVRATSTVTIEDSDTNIATAGELDALASDVIAALGRDISASLHKAYELAATNASTTLSVTDSNFTTAAANVIPGLTIVAKAFFGVVSAEITSAAANNTAAADFAQALMTANSATKLFDPGTIIGTYINGNGTYIGSHNLASLTSAIENEYATFKTYAVETVGDVFGTDTASNFASAIVNMLTTGNDTETLTSASEIIATFDGTDTVYGGGGNDKFIGGKDVDTFYGQAGNDHLYGFTGNDVLDGGDGNDRIVGGLGDDTISGGAGNDYILAQTGNDTISSGTGNDEIDAGLGNDAITLMGW